MSGDDETYAGPCVAVVWRGSPWGDTPEPDEFCSRDAEDGSEYCRGHQDEDDA